MSRSDGIDELDPRFPIRHSLPPSAFWEMAHLRPDRPAHSGLTVRARAEEACQVETFVRPLPPLEDLPAVEFAPRVYRELAEDTLTQEEVPDYAFLAAPLEPLP